MIKINPQQRILSLILIMASIVLAIEAITIGILYHTALAEQRARLEETAKSQARLIEAIARFGSDYSNDYPYGARQATIDQIKDAHSQYQGFGKTGEFVLSAKEKDYIVFLLSHRHYDLENPKPVPWNSELAEPTRLALSGQSGTIIGIDYRGEEVLAAYEPVAELNLGIVAKIDLAEIRAPFIKAGFISGLFAIALIGLGVSFFRMITDPILQRLGDTVEELQKTLDALKVTEKILNTAQKMATIGSWHFDIEKGKLTWTNEVYRIFGRDPEEFEPTYEAFLEAIHPEDKELVDTTYTNSIKNNEPYEIVHRIIRPSGEVRIVHEQSEDITDTSGRTIHSFGMVHDITEAKANEQERENLIAELQKSLSEIKTLRGIIPICSFCKKIRDDKGYWDQVEVYVRLHTEASFSHGICPECAEMHYGEYLHPPKKNNGGQPITSSN